MDSMRILIAGLAAACLLVACLIIVVLRRPRPAGSKRQRVDEAEAHTLSRIYAVQTARSRPALEEPALPPQRAASAQAPFGRMPDLPAFPPLSDERDHSQAAARISAGSESFEGTYPQSGWGNGTASTGGLPTLGGLSSPDVRAGNATFDGGRRNNSGAMAGTGGFGRMPGFAPADPAPSNATGRQADPMEQRRAGALTRVFAEGIQVAYDPTADAVDVIFAACPVRTPAEVALAFRVLLAKVRTVLKPLERDRAALLMDSAGLEVSANCAPVWGESLSAFLTAACEQPEPGYVLIARYNSRAPSVGNQQAILRHIQSASPAVARGLQGTMLGSREEAVALLARLREPSTIPGH
ncbi:MAG TPA: hypothetical protein VKQ30_02955 [Ktedonobacterales bacterium]|nr:hypothetical protein [Ktedonobacterales bacterium]